MLAQFDDHGMSFAFPEDWELDVAREGARTTVALQSADGAAFALITLDEDRPTPAELDDAAVDAMREEYPDLEAVPVREVVNGQVFIGHDLAFTSLDMAAACAIRCFRTSRRTIFILGQWSDLDHVEFEAQLRALRRSLKETDGPDPI